MKALITGGSGFIGSHLADLLIEKGYQVIVIDNLSAGRIENISHLLDNNNFEFFQVDILNFKEIRPLFNNINFVSRSRCAIMHAVDNLANVVN